MRKIKLLGLAVAAVVMVMGLAACKGNQSQTKEQKPQQMTEQRTDELKENKMDMKCGDSCDKAGMKDDRIADKTDMKDIKMLDKTDIQDDKTNYKTDMKDYKTDDEMMKTSAKVSHGKMKKAMKDEMKTIKKVNDGDLASDFTLEDAEGNLVKLSDLQGRKVYVKFWASWCPICLSGLEELNNLAKDNKDFEIITVVAPNVYGEKDKEDFIKWFDSLGYDNIKVLFDESGDVVKKYGVRAYPTSLIIGTDGVLIEVRTGHMDKTMIEERFKDVK